MENRIMLTELSRKLQVTSLGTNLQDLIRFNKAGTEVFGTKKLWIAYALKDKVANLEGCQIIVLTIIIFLLILCFFYIGSCFSDQFLNVYYQLLYWRFFLQQQSAFSWKRYWFTTKRLKVRITHWCINVVLLANLKEAE